MSFIIGTSLALIFLDGFWRIAAIAGLAAIEIFEIFIWLRWRNVRSITGAESLVGMRGKAVTDISGDDGQVRVKGQLWKATGSGIAEGDTVVVQAVEGMRLLVGRAPG